MTGPYGLCALAVAAAAVTVGLTVFVVKPALAQVKAERQQSQAQRNHAMAAQIQQARSRVVFLTVEGLYAKCPDLWDEFIAAHADQPSGGA